MARLVLDWDGTVTVVDTLWLVLGEFGDEDVFRRASGQLRAGEMGLREAMEIEFATITNAPLEDVNAWLAENAEFRPASTSSCGATTRSSCRAASRS